MHEDGVYFGTELHTPPFKRSSSRHLSFQAPPPLARRRLNFSGEQKERVISVTSSSSLNGGRQKGLPMRQAAAVQMKSESGQVTKEHANVEEVLAQGVKNMAMASPAKSPMLSTGSRAMRRWMLVKECRGLDSYDGSSDASLAAQEHSQDRSLSLQERLCAAKVIFGSLLERSKQSIRSPGASREIAK